MLFYIQLFSFPKMHSCSVILRFRSHCIYVLTINGSCWSESLMRFWLHLHLNLVYSAGDRVCLENEISVIISSFTCLSWEDSLCSTLWKVISYKLSVKWEGAEENSCWDFKYNLLVYEHIENGPRVKILTTSVLRVK